MSETELEEFNYYLTHMEESPLKNYIEERVIAQINWYDKKSIAIKAKEQKWFKMAVISNAIVPVIVLLSDCGPLIKILIAFLSSASGTITSILNKNNDREIWIQYRANCEKLKSILHSFFLEQNFPVYDEKSINSFINTCEACLTEEVCHWQNAMLKQEKNRNN